MGIVQTPETRKRLHTIPEFNCEHKRILLAAVSDDGPVVELVVPGWIGQLLDKTPAWRNLVALVAKHDLIRKSQKHQLDHPAVNDELMGHCRSFMGGTLFYLGVANEAHFLGITTPEELGEFQYNEANEWTRQAESLAGGADADFAAFLEKYRYASPAAALAWLTSDYPHYLSWLAQELATNDQICPEATTRPAPAGNPPRYQGNGVGAVLADTRMHALMGALSGRLGGAPGPEGWTAYPLKTGKKKAKGEPIKMKAWPRGDMAPLVSANTTNLSERELLLELLDSSVVLPVLESIERERNETKAKTFMVALSLGIMSGSPTEFRVNTKQLMGALGYELGRKTNTKNYWAKTTEVLRYLTVDLPGTLLHIRVQIPGSKKNNVEEEYLMQRPRAIGEQLTLPLEGFHQAMIQRVGAGDEQAMVELVRQTAPEALKLGFPSNILECLGALKGRAVEKVPEKVFSLSGPAFWLAYHLCFLRRWGDGTTPKPHQCPTLREALDDGGHLAQETKGDKVRVKDALSIWFRDLEKLTSCGILGADSGTDSGDRVNSDDAGPGVQIYRQAEGGKWLDVTNEIHRKTDAGAGRLTLEELDKLRVLYLLPAARLEQRAMAKQVGARKKAAGIARGKARKAENP